MEFTGNQPVDILIAISALLGTVFSFMKWVLPYLKQMQLERLNAKNVAAFDQGLRAIMTVTQLMDDLRQHLKITRVLLIEVSNGGDMPIPGSRIYATAVNAKMHNEMGETDRMAEVKALADYNRIAVDDCYIRMLIQAQSQGHYKFVTSKEQDCLLKDIYTTAGVHYSEIYHIYTDGIAKKMFILSVATSLPDEDFSKAPLRAMINTAINSIRSHFEEFRLQVR